MTKKEIAEILKRCRNNAGFTQKEVSDKIGRPQQTLASWETGKSQPDANTLFELCDLYGVSVNDAFGYTKKRPDEGLTPAEREVIKKYRALDERGKAAVDMTLDREFSESTRSASVAADAAATVRGLDTVLSENCPTGAKK